MISRVNPLGIMNIFIAIFLSLSLSISAFVNLAVFDNESEHLAQHASANHIHHENIDDSPHTHTHKHSDGGEEHEHEHEHSKFAHSEVKVLSCEATFALNYNPKDSQSGFGEQNLISNPHPSKIYRPPIFS